ncbi:hypothetical protein LQ948_07290 [Jiella sp. MQZ9-1]|uniref:Uncharacterized protein n=1 Tax=Jiella flava TaxID=2816857 RepID=A0A939FWR2_9HYPH|nr:hypothetical protein [Jiella flava]MBO0662161.1 hypothetical protein [Jiella flava]MCD2471009.1 hypothetical protein [Jiella flava]
MDMLLKAAKRTGSDKPAEPYDDPEVEEIDAFVDLEKKRNAEREHRGDVPDKPAKNRGSARR